MAERTFSLAAVALVAIMVSLTAAKGTRSPYWGEYNTTSGPVDGKINVHLVPHTHDDTGWLMTVDAYFYKEVAYILDTVSTRLEENPDRKFMYVETGFFERWWIEQTEEKKASFRKLVASGQLEFINGGWCMHDEASPNYVEMVENTGRGHQFLQKEFGVFPKGTWQIDPFGHTNTQSWLIGQYAGLQFLYFGRMDYQDFQMRKNLSSLVEPNVPRSLEWVWQGSKTFGKQYQTFTGELYGSGGGGYGAPSGLGFDGSDNQVQDDPRINDYNLDEMLDKFISAAQDQAAHMRTDHIMWAMGSDFNYQNAQHWYKNIDKLIHHVNRNGTVNAFYSTPSIYTEEKHKAGLTWEARFDDVMPLADNAHHYWTGYFTSRQSLKKYLRTLSNLLQSGRQLALLANSTSCTSTSRTQTLCTDDLEAAIAVTTHHDGLSGTEKQQVADDYSQRMSWGEHRARTMIAELVGKTVGLDNVEQCFGERGLNISICSFTTDNDEFTVVAYNNRGHASTQMLRLPIKGTTATVTTSAGDAVASQTIPITARDKALPALYLEAADRKNPTKIAEFTNNATHVLAFSASLPAAGWATYRVKVGAVAPASSVSEPIALAPEDDLTISNGIYEVSFDQQTGTMAKVTNTKSGVSANVAIDIGFYNSSVGGCTPGVGMGAKRNRREEYEYGMDDPVYDLGDDNKFACDGQPSGAYIFRPNSSNVYPAACTTTGGCGAKPTFTAVKGDLVSEVYITFADWATVVVRLVKDTPNIEVEYTVGPIPMHSFESGHKYLQGKEVVLRYNTSLKTEGVFYHDSNGREMIRREINKRGPAYPHPYNISEPAAGNFYPVNALMALEDESTGASFGIAVDRSLGGASLASGELELMVHRRTQADDRRGVGEPMNETMCGCNNGPNPCHCEGLTIKGSNYIVLDKTAAAHQARREASEQVNFDATLAFSKSEPKTKTFSSLAADLPANVKLMTYGVVSPQYNDKVYVRLSHVYEAGEHPELSKSVNVSLATVFGGKIKSAVEMSLSGTRTPAEIEAMKLKWPVAGEEKQMPKVAGCESNTCTHEPIPFDADSDDMIVNLRPMDIRTFAVTLA
eukprot:m.479938 g.479938  ORF g.479938 m.479938 type:complete len:1085 (+) comp21646_c0_seq1:45-3299(+)